MSSYRILYLRPFWDPQTSAKHLKAVHQATQAFGKLVAIKNGDEDRYLRFPQDGNAWSRYGFIGAWIYDQINPPVDPELIEATDDTWQEVVIAEMQCADAIVMLIGLDSPDQDLALLDSLLPNTNPKTVIDFSHNPIRKFTDRIGVLRELDYCQKSNALRKLIALTPERLLPRLTRALEILNMSHRGQWIQKTSEGLVPLSASMRGADFSLLGLPKIYSIIPYSRSGAAGFGGGLFCFRLFSALNGLLEGANAPSARHLPTANVSGIPNKPVALPPDGKMKLIRFTPIQNLIKIPSGDIVELSFNEVQILEPCIKEEEITCPKCGKGREKMFWFQYGTELALNNSRGIYMYCQYCGHENYL